MRVLIARTSAAAVAAILCVAAVIDGLASNPTAARGVRTARSPSIAAKTDAQATGQIVFTAKVRAHTQLFTIAPDGSALRQITHFADGDAQNANWSPDGTRIIFERDFPTTDSATHAGIYSVNRQGRELHALTPNHAVYETVPAFAPDGKHIVFNHDNGKRDELWTMKIAGRDRRQITPTNPKGSLDHFEDLPRFSPDGQRIVFVNEIGSRAAVFVVNADGTDMRQLSSYALGATGRVDWSPDGSRILFSSGSPRAVSNLYTVRPDGHQLTRLTDNAAGTDSIAGSWSPDGHQLVFTQISAHSEDLYLLNADGTKRSRLTHGIPIIYGHGGAWGAQP